MKKYSWKSVGFSADPNKVGKELETIEVLGELNNRAVLDYAEKNTNSELYKCFEWDNEIAGEKYRLFQANNILCSISLEIKEEPAQKQRVYVNVRSCETEKRTFKNINEVLKNDDEYSQLINKAKDELKTYTDKYNSLLDKEDLKNVIFEIYREI